MADKNYDRAKDLYAHSAIAERDLLQAESDRNQAQADLNAALLGLKILASPSRKISQRRQARPKFRCSRPSEAKSSNAYCSRPVAHRRHHPGVRHLGHEYSLGASQRLSERSRLVKVGDDVVIQTDSYAGITFHGKISLRLACG